MFSWLSQNCSALLILLKILVLFFLGILIWLLLARVSAPKKNSQKTKEPEDITTDQQNGLLGYPIRVFVERLPPPNPTQEARENRKETRERNNLIIQTGIGVFACVYATITLLMWC